MVDPLALRARRVRALFLCGLQEGVFPASARPEPLLAEEDRRRLAETSGLLLGGVRGGMHWRPSGMRCTRSCRAPEELLVMSWHAGDDDGVAQARSLFVDDVMDLFDEGLEERRARRPLAAVAGRWPMRLSRGPAIRLRGARFHLAGGIRPACNRSGRRADRRSLSPDAVPTTLAHCATRG